MRHISLREANQRFSSCIADVEKGEHLVVERRGVPVAEIIPFRTRASSAERDKAWKDMLALLEIGIPLGGKAPSKDEMHER
jgi:antitoxin (DNA-binding transcriptional repressor) of toxin-antitoxin stability system